MGRTVLMPIIFFLKMKSLLTHGIDLSWGSCWHGGKARRGLWAERSCTAFCESLDGTSQGLDALRVVCARGRPPSHSDRLPDGGIAVAADICNAEVIGHQKQDVGTGARQIAARRGPHTQEERSGCHSQPAPERQAAQRTLHASLPFVHCPFSTWAPRSLF